MIDSPFSQFVGLVNSQSLLWGLKWVVLFGYLLYAVFAIVVVVQVQKMFNSMNTGGKTIFYTIGLINLGLSLLALMWAFVVL